MNQSQGEANRQRAPWQWALSQQPYARRLPAGCVWVGPWNGAPSYPGP